MSAEMFGIVLAAGNSSRMWPLGDKHLLRFAGQRLVAAHLRSLSAAGVERFVLVGNPSNLGALREEVEALPLDVKVIEQTTVGGMAGGVLDAISQLGGNEQERAVYVTQPHDVVDGSLHRDLIMMASHGGAYAHVAGARQEEPFPGGYLKLDGGRVTGIVEKPARGSEPSNVVTIVAHLFADTRPLFQELQRQVERYGVDDAYERALGELMAQHEFRLVPYEGSWRPIKYPWHVLDVMQLVLEQAQRGEIDPGPQYKQVESGVFLGEGVKVFAGGHVAAPAIVGRDAVIGNNALVRESIIGDGCVVGFGSEVARSYLGDGCQLHHNYVGDSVLERDVLFGFGMITANFRLDEKSVKTTVRGERVDTGRTKLGLIAGAGAKIGVGTNVMPGVKIGAGAIVGPGQTVMSDIPDRTQLLSDQGGKGL